jgi:hypothetical protein
MTTQLLFKEESYKIIGASFEVYREKGCGLINFGHYPKAQLERIVAEKGRYAQTK